MASKREKTPPMRMRRIALVICEGETEEAYVGLLRQWYKSPLKVISHIEGSRVTPSLVENRVRETKISARDRVDVFLMYDMDVPAINEKLRGCSAALLLSNPCFELWLLLHARDLKSPITTAATLKELEKSASVWKNYRKAFFTDTQTAFLKAHTETAVRRAKVMKECRNPSTGVYKLVETLKNAAR